MTLTKSIKSVKRIITREDWLKRNLLIVITIWLLVTIVFPLSSLISNSFFDPQGRWVGFANYFKYLHTPALKISFFNSCYVAIAATVIAVILAFIFAYGLTRTKMRGKPFFWTVGMLPLYIPPLASGIGLIYLFGNKGLVTTGIFGLLPGWDIQLYGANGIIIGEFLYVFPQVLLILATALSLTDARLYEAAEALKTPPWRIFLTVTLPGVKYGLVSAFFVGFILSFTDFGVPKVVGGDFNVLATDIYKQVIGQQNFSMGATISVFLLLPTVIAFIVDRIIQRRQTALISDKAVPLRPKSNSFLEQSMLLFCGLISLTILVILLTIILASLVKIWPYDFSFSFKNYDFSKVPGGGYAAYFNSILMAFYTAILGTILVFIGAYLVEKSQELSGLRSFNYFLSILPLALPGLVLGLAYVFFFNDPSWTIANWAILNPFHKLYGTMIILVICNITHFYTVCFLTANTALKQLDPEFEAVSASMGVPFYKTFWRVTIPLSLSAILEIGIYFFVNAMVTVSAIIFLYPPNIPLAAVAIVNMDDSGDIAAAAAMSSLIVITSLGVRILYGFMAQKLQNRSQAWLRR